MNFRFKYRNPNVVLDNPASIKGARVKYSFGLENFDVKSEQEALEYVEKKIQKKKVEFGFTLQIKPISLEKVEVIKSW